MYEPLPRPAWRRPGLVATLVFMGVAVLCCAGVATLALMGLGQWSKHSSDKGPLRDGVFEFAVGSTRCGLDSVGEGWVRAKAHGQFCVVELTVTNIGDRAQRFADGNQRAFGRESQRYVADTGAGVAANGSGDGIWNVVNPGNSLTVKVVFDIPVSASITAIELHDSALSHGKTVEIGPAAGT